jgi:hypothetical protein
VSVELPRAPKAWTPGELLPAEDEVKGHVVFRRRLHTGSRDVVVFEAIVPAARAEDYAAEYGAAPAVPGAVGDSKDQAALDAMEAEDRG